MKSDTSITQPWAPLDKLEAVLDRWAQEHTGVMSLEVVGRSVAERPIYAATITDPTVDDEEKEHVLISALHSGVPAVLAPAGLSPTTALGG